MAGSRRQQERVRKARRLYVQGMDRDAIARTLGVSKGAVSLWQNRDQKAGVSWDEQRECAHAHKPEAILGLLEGRLADLVIEGPPKPPSRPAGGAKDKASESETSASAATQNASDNKDCKAYKECKEYEARLLNMIKVIQGYRDTAGEPALQMRALERFAEFCASELTPEQVAAVREAVERFIEHLRRQCE